MKTIIIKSILGVLMAMVLVHCASEEPVNSVERSSALEASPVPTDCSAVVGGGLHTAGCLFYGVSYDSSSGNVLMKLALSNVQREQESNFEIWGSVWDSDAYYVHNAGEWQKLADGTISPLGVEVVDLTGILLNQFSDCYLGNENPKGIIPEGAYKVVSDVPISVAQGYVENEVRPTSDASMLIPVASWSTEHQVVGYRTTTTVEVGSAGPYTIQMELAYAAVVASEDNTEVTVRPSVPTRLSYISWEDNTEVVPATEPEFTVTLNTADVLYVHADRVGDSLSGTRISSSAGKPIGVFSGHQCAIVPENAGYCDQIEEQIPGVEHWGRRFVAARFPNRNEVEHSDPVLWQIHASVDGTQVSFAAPSRVQGLPDGPITLGAGEVYEMMVYGSALYPGDFRIDATEPVAVLQYMTGSGLTVGQDGTATTMGDPSLAYVPPMDQLLARYAVTMLEGWDEHYLVVTRPAGLKVLVDGEVIDHALFRGMPKIDATESFYEVARIPVAAGPHTVESFDGKQGIGLIAVGINEGSSYAYAAGMGN